MQVAPVAYRIAAARILDLDDIGAELREHPSGKRPGDQRSEFEDLEARKRSRHS